jgi:hypothetical protein
MANLGSRCVCVMKDFEASFEELLYWVLSWTGGVVVCIMCGDFCPVDLQCASHITGRTVCCIVAIRF